jgi:hypothetical protein
MKVTQQMIDMFYDQLAGGFVMPEEARAGLQAVLDALPEFTVEGDEVTVHSVITDARLADVLRDGYPVQTYVSVHPIPAVRQEHKND